MYSNTGSNRTRQAVNSPCQHHTPFRLREDPILFCMAGLPPPDTRDQNTSNAEIKEDSMVRAQSYERSQICHWVSNKKNRSANVIIKSNVSEEWFWPILFLFVLHFFVYFHQIRSKIICSHRVREWTQELAQTDQWTVNRLCEVGDFTLFSVVVLVSTAFRAVDISRPTIRPRIRAPVGTCRPWNIASGEQPSPDHGDNLTQCAQHWQQSGNYPWPHVTR